MFPVLSMFINVSARSLGLHYLILIHFKGFKTGKHKFFLGDNPSVVLLYHNTRSIGEGLGRISGSGNKKILNVPQFNNLLLILVE